MAGDVIALSGALGTGKSALARSIIQAVDPSEVDVPSPTFTIVQYYNLSDKTPLLHMDLYRIDSAKDAMSLGLDEAFVEAVCLIEWPDRLEKYLPQSQWCHERVGIPLHGTRRHAPLLRRRLGFAASARSL